MTTFYPRFKSVAVCSLVFCLHFGASTVAQIPTMAPKTNTRAVVVGISDYLNIAKLQFAHKDAEAFVEFLRSPAGGNIPAENIKLLTNENATQAQIVNALTWLDDESLPGDQGIIYFSGHGDVETKMAKMGYLLAYNATKSAYMSGGAIPINWLQAVIANLAEQKQVKVLLIADACRSGNLAGEATGGSRNTALAMATRFDYEIKIMSCGPDEVSLEGTDWGGGRSVFSYYLIEGLKGLADGSSDGMVDGKVTLREIGRFLQDSVERATQSIRLQSPMICCNGKAQVAKVDAATLAALRQKNNPPKIEPVVATTSKNPPSGRQDTDSVTMEQYRAFEDALRAGHLLFPEKDAAYSIYQQIKDRPAIRVYRNSMRNDLAAALQEEAQKAINDYLSADPREIRRRWALDDKRYKLYPQYLEKAAELLGATHFSYGQLKAREFYFSGLNLRLQGERPDNAAIKDSLFRAAKVLQEKTLELDSTAAYAYNELGLLARRFQQYEQSVGYFNRALLFSPTWVLPWANICMSYNDLDQTELAEKSGLKALSLDSTLAWAHFNLGYTYLTKQDEAEATQHFQKTILYDPDYINAYFNLGNVYYNTGDFVQAEEMWEKYRKRNPIDPAVYNSLGEVCAKLGKRKEAESYFLKAIELDPTFGNPYIGLSTLYLYENKYELSKNWFEQFSKLRPDDPDGHYYLALRNCQDYPVALRHLETAFKKGFKDYNRMKNEALLAPLRSKTEYTKLVKKYFPDKV